MFKAMPTSVLLLGLYLYASVCLTVVVIHVATTTENWLPMLVLPLTFGSILYVGAIWLDEIKAWRTRVKGTEDA